VRQEARPQLAYQITEHRLAARLAELLDLSRMGTQ